MSDFYKIVGQKKPTVVDFFATWCGPCQAMHPVLEQLKKNVGDKATILKIDVDKNQPLAAHYGIRSVPTIMIFKEGAVVYRASGVHQAADLERLIDQNL